MTFDILHPATYIPLIAGVIIPFGVALIAKQDGSPAVKSVLAALGGALAALAVYLQNTAQVSWSGALSAFILALVIAAASRKTLTEQYVAATAAKVPGGIG